VVSTILFITSKNLSHVQFLDEVFSKKRAARHGPLSKHFLHTRIYENTFTKEVFRRLRTILLKVSAGIGGFLFFVQVKKENTGKHEALGCMRKRFMVAGIRHVIFDNSRTNENSKSIKAIS